MSAEKPKRMNTEVNMGALHKPKVPGKHENLPIIKISIGLMTLLFIGFFFMMLHVLGL